MSSGVQHVIALARVALGWLFFHAGLQKVMDPEWTSLPYIEHAKTFPELYQVLSAPDMIQYVDIANEWGLMLIGASLILGLFVRLSSLFGAILMALYYLPILDFPYVGEHAFIVNDHIIYILLLLIFFGTKAGQFVGLDERFTLQFK